VPSHRTTTTPLMVGDEYGPISPVTACVWRDDRDFSGTPAARASFYADLPFTG
jgi:hypothetical protein